MQLRPAPPLVTSDWLNTPRPLNVPDFRGKVLVIEAFQMLCPGCVSYGLPQAQRVMQAFPRDQVAVIGLHTVFEHHEAQGTRAALEAFAHEYRLTFPIGIDVQHGRLPVTMVAYEMQGTPTLIVIDRNGKLRFQKTGHVDDLTLGALIGTLVAEPLAGGGTPDLEYGCTDEGCAVPATGA